jgi:hypothetical protein
MGTVTYINQPGIHKTRGAVPLAGTKHLYTVDKILWPPEIEEFLETLFIGTTLHACCGKSTIGTILLDQYEEHADVKCDAANMRGVIPDNGVETVLCDPPYNGSFQWNHDLLTELWRVASKRIIFQHWFIMATPQGYYKKNYKTKPFKLTALYAWQGKTYFGRAQLIQVYDRVE